jgi:hypothetical protein
MNGTWGQPTVFLTPPAGKTYNFPMFSYNAEWIAFNIGNGGHTDINSQPMLVAADGKADRPHRANRVVSNEMTDGITRTPVRPAPEGDPLDRAQHAARVRRGLRRRHNQIRVAIDREASRATTRASRLPGAVPGPDEANYRAF